MKTICIALAVLVGLCGSALAAELPRVPGPCDHPTRPGAYKAGEWEYVYKVQARGSRSEKRIGLLKRGGAEVAGKVGAVIETPLGRFKYFAERYNTGWLNTLTFDGAVFPEGAGAALVKGNNDFAFDLYGRLRSGDGNLALSPHGISSSLAMASAGARGATLAQMSKVLHFPEQEKLHPAFADLVRGLNGHGLPRDYRLAVASSLWGQRDYGFLPDFQEVLRRSYGSRLREVDFARAPNEARLAINGWAEEHTAGKVKGLPRPGVVTPLTRLVLANAVSFQATWESPFESKDTRPAEFRRASGGPVAVRTMQVKAMLRHYRGPGVEALELPYQGKDLSMLVLLPGKADGLPALEKSLTADRVTEWSAELKEGLVEVFLPKFKVAGAFDLKSTLSGMGMPDAFDFARADFSGMNGKKNLAITAVAHKAFVEVHERGTEAGAATAVVIGERSVATPFRADRPFVFVVRHNRSGVVLFLGRVVDPSAGG